MAYPQLTPKLKARGTYGVRKPFTIGEGVSYTCIAIRSFADVYREGKNPYFTVYKPIGLVDGLTLDDGTIFSFEEESLRGINLITLVDDRGTAVVVPDNYITSYPSESNIKYREFYLSCSLGALNDDIDTSHAETAVKEAVSGVMGIDVDVNVHTLPTLTTPTYEQHLALEAARAAAIALAKDSATIIAEKDAMIDELTKVNESLMLVIRDNGLLGQLT